MEVVGPLHGGQASGSEARAGLGQRAGVLGDREGPVDWENRAVSLESEFKSESGQSLGAGRC